MSKEKQTPFEAFDWSEIQEKYVEALKAFNSPQSSMDSVWVTAMNDWWQSTKPEMPNDAQNMFEKVLQQYRNYYFMSEQFSNLIEGLNQAKNNNESVTAFINKTFKEIEAVFSNGANAFDWNSFLDGFEQPVDLIKNVFSSSLFNAQGLFDPANVSIGNFQEQLLSMPGLGYSRETQDKIKKAIKLWAEYQANYQEYQTVILGLNRDALELIRKRIISMSKKDEAIDSMRQIYDMWIDSNEKVYGDYVHTKEYAELNGRLVNSMMAFKKQSQDITDDVLSSMNMPTKKSMGELERRHYELRKQVKAMQIEVASLKKQLEEKGSTSSIIAKELKPAVKRKKKTKKKRVVKKTSNDVQIKQAKKKTTANKKTSKKKTKRNTKKKPSNKDMIEIKF